MNVSDNFTDNSSHEFLILDPFVYAAFSLVTIFGSSAVFYLFSITEALRSITGYLMVIITLTDTGTTVFVLLPSVYTTIAGHVPWSDMILCSLQAYSNMFLQNFKANLIMLCAIERAFSLQDPFKYQRVASKNLLAVCMAIITALAMVMPTYLWAIMGWRGEAPPGSPLCWPMVQDESAFYVYWVSIFLDLICPGIIVILAYGKIIMIVVKQRESMREQQQELSSVNRNATGSSRKTPVANAGITFMQHLAACKMLFIVTLLYFLAHIPIFIADHFFSENFVVVTICNYLAYFNTWTNFFIYYKTDNRFQTAAKKWFNHITPSCLQQRREAKKTLLALPNDNQFC